MNLFRSCSGWTESEGSEIVINHDVMAHIFQQRLIPCAPSCISPNETCRMRWRTMRTGTAGLPCAWHSQKMIQGCPFWAMGFAFTLSVLPGFVHLLAGSLALAPVAGSLVFSMRSLRDARDFGGSRGNAALFMAGPSLSESQKGQAARAFPHKGKEAEFI